MNRYPEEWLSYSCSEYWRTPVNMSSPTTERNQRKINKIDAINDLVDNFKQGRPKTSAAA